MKQRQPTFNDLFGDSAQASFVKLLRKKRRELRARDSAGLRRLAKLSDRELAALETLLLEQAINQLRSLPSYASNPEAQERVANYEYELRLLRDMEALRNVPRPPIVRRRYIPSEQAKAPRPINPAPVLPPPVATPQPEPENLSPKDPPSNVVPFRCYGKAFGIGGERHHIGGED